MGTKRLLTTMQVAEQLGVSRTFVYGLLRAGQLRRIKIGRLTRVAQADLSDYVARQAEKGIHAGLEVSEAER